MREKKHRKREQAATVYRRWPGGRGRERKRVRERAKRVAELEKLRQMFLSLLLTDRFLQIGRAYD